MSDLLPFDSALLTADNLLIVGVGLIILIGALLWSNLSHRSRVKELLTIEHEIGHLREELAAERVRAERLPLVEEQLRDVSEERDGYLIDTQRLEAQLRSQRETHEARLEELRSMK